MRGKNIILRGSLLPPLKIGERALVLYDGELSGTAPVVKIGPLTMGRALFETGEAVYCLVPLSPPQSISAPEGFANVGHAAAA